MGKKKIALFISAAGLKEKVQITFSHWWFSAFLCVDLCERHDGGSRCLREAVPQPVSRPALGFLDS